MVSKLKKLAKWFGMSVFGFIVFIVTLNMMLDWELIKTKMETVLSKSTGYEVSIGEMGLLGLSGIRLQEVTMVKQPDKKGEKPTRIAIDNFEIKSGVFALLSGKKEFDFSVDLLGGNVNGTIVTEGKTKEFKLEWSDLRLDKLPGMASVISLPLKGRLSGNGNLTIPREGMRKADGNIYLTCKSCVIGDGKHKVSAKFIRNPRNKAKAKWAKDGFTLPPLSLGDFNGNISIKKGKATFEDFVAASKDGDMELLGTIRFNNTMKLSTATMYFKFKFSEKAKKKHPVLEGIEASMLLRGLRKDGYLGMSINGRLFSLAFRPSKRGIGDFGKHSKFKKNNRKRHRPAFMKPIRHQKPRIKRPKLGGIMVNHPNDY